MGEKVWVGWVKEVEGEEEGRSEVGVLGRRRVGKKVWVRAWQPNFVPSCHRW